MIKAMSKHMWCDAGERRTRDDLVPVLGKPDERLSLERSDEYGPGWMLWPSSGQQLDCRQSYGAHRCTFLAVVRRMQLLSISTSGQMRLIISPRQPVRAIVLAITAAAAS